MNIRKKLALGLATVAVAAVLPWAGASQASATSYSFSMGCSVIYERYEASSSNLVAQVANTNCLLAQASITFSQSGGKTIYGDAKAQGGISSIDGGIWSWSSSNYCRAYAWQGDNTSSVIF
jgi:hypothetical protein